MTHIAIDMDDVIVDFLGGLLAAVKNEFDVEIPREAVTQWDLHPILDQHIGRSFWTWLREREWLWANFPAVPGAIGGIERLRNDGHYLEIVTSKPRWAEHNVWKWLGKWRPAVHSVTVVGPGDCKADFTEANVLIDDKPENIEHFLRAGRHGIVFRRPHNQGSIIPVPNGADSRLHTADDWRAVLEIVNGR